MNRITLTVSTKIAAFAALLLAFPAFAQTKEYSLYELNPFGGYQWYKDRAPSYRLENGFIYGIRFGQDVFRYVGIEESFTTGQSDVRLFAPPDPRKPEFDSRMYQFGFNPLFYFTPRESRVRPFLTVGPVITKYDPDQSTLKELVPGDPGFGTKLQAKWGAGLMVGAGIKFQATRRIGLRFDVRGLWTERPHFNLPWTSGPSSFFIPQGGSELPLQLTAGIIFRFGLRGQTPPPPPTAVVTPPPPPEPPPAPKPIPEVPKPKPVEVRLSAIQGAADVCPGDTLTLQSTATVTGGGAPTYQWLVNGQAVAGTNSPTFQLPTQGRTGQLTVAVRATAGGVTSNSDPVTIRLRANQPPVVTFTVQPSSIERGATAQLVASAVTSDCGGTSTIRYTATEGTITGTTYDSTTVAFDPNVTRLQTKTVTLTATATDQRGATGSAQAPLTVTLKPVARRLSDIVYPANSSRVNNCAKRILIEELTPLLRNDPNAKVILVGHRDASERGANLDQQRVLNAAAVLSAGTGICPQLELSRVEGDWLGVDQTTPLRPELCGASTKERPGQSLSAADERAPYRRVEIWVVPEGADLPPGVRAPKTLPTAQVKALSCPI